MTLNEALEAEGFKAAPSPQQYARDIVDENGEVVFTGKADQVWEWLRETKG